MNNLLYRLGQLFAAKLLFVAGALSLVALVLLRQALAGQGMVEGVLEALEVLLTAALLGSLIHYYVGLIQLWRTSQDMPDSDDPFAPSKAFIVGCYVGVRRLRQQFHGYWSHRTGR